MNAMNSNKENFSKKKVANDSTFFFVNFYLENLEERFVDKILSVIALVLEGI